MIEGRIGLGQITVLTFFTPAALTGTVSLYAGATEGLAVASMSPVYNGTTAVTLAAARAIVVVIGAFRSIALSSGTAEAADRTFTVLAQVDSNS